MRTLNVKLSEFKSEIGYIGFAEYSNLKVTTPLDKNDILKFLHYYYSSNKVTAYQNKTDHLPFPFRTENLTSADIHKIYDNVLFKIKTIFRSFEKGWENFESDLKRFESNLESINIKLRELNLCYPCFMLTIDDFNPKSNKINGLFNEMGFIYDYFFFIIFMNPSGNLTTLEISYD
ncbi:hypothetical protein [uncultured Marixanthomonas sp.]|uniref:hypothetical protein n=1 Tax=uncultured Marixanthomonas sp. TaxID=757245 RepID=UPI0030D8660F|tara:strand:+ start:261637 stop:262164 length:528 start_codon:yes stop_codon:yes gene_type:complete